MMSYGEERELVENTIKSYPSTFRLRAYPSDLFRLDAFKSYVNDSGSLQLVVQRLVNEAWLDFTRTTVSELDSCMLAEKTPKASQTAPKLTEIEIKERTLTDGSKVFSVEFWKKNERIELDVVDFPAACELRDAINSIKLNTFDFKAACILIDALKYNNMLTIDSNVNVVF